MCVGEASHMYTRRLGTCGKPHLQTHVPSLIYANEATQVAVCYVSFAKEMAAC